MPRSGECEGMFCLDNIRGERPFYTMDAARARAYFDWLESGGWRGVRLRQFRDGEWRDVLDDFPGAT